MPAIFRTAIRLVLVVFLVLSLGANCTGFKSDKKRISFAAIEQGFRTPPDSVKPSCYWYWLSDNVSEQGVVKDLEAMAKVGIGGAFIGNIGLDGPDMPYGDVKLFSDEWWRITEQAIRTAGRVGVDIGIFNSPGWSQSGGPWIKPETAMRYLSTSELSLHGPQSHSARLPDPGANFQLVSLLAFPAPDLDGESIAARHPRIRSLPVVDKLAHMLDGDPASEALLAIKGPAAMTWTIDLQVDEPYCARSLTLYPAHTPFKADCELLAFQDGAFHTLKSFVLDRSNPALHVGFIPYAPLSIAFPACTSSRFRLILTNLKKTAGFAEIELSAAPRLERYMEKQLAKMFQTPLPLWQEYQWPQQPEPQDRALVVDPARVLDISKNFSSDGILHWNVPAGRWIILRLGMVPTGVSNAPASPEGRGLEVDKMNRAALAEHFQAFIGRILERMPAEERKAFKLVVADSYETGSENWTDAFADTFQQRYGYDPRPWLPVLTGRIVSSADQSDRFLWDLRRLVADLVAYQYVGGLRDLCHAHGLKLWLENYGHWGYPSEFLTYGGQSDEIGGEFWAEGDLGSIELRAASSAAHIYGKTRVSAESFTASAKAYFRYPALLKKRGDWSFTEGINHTLLHVYVTQPYEDRVPGVNAWFGTEFNRFNTWFDQSRPFMDYLRRCNFMLQQGLAVADVAYFIGEDAPKMTGVRDPDLPAGYSFDYINAEVILTRLAVRDGRLVLPDGMSYRLLVLPKMTSMRPEVLRKIRDLVQAGAVILGPPPQRSPSLQYYPGADEEVCALAAELWGEVDGVSVKSARFGRGMVMMEPDMQSALQHLDLVPDFRVADPSVLYAHRSLGSGEVYFISNQSDHSVSINPQFRVTGLQPELWDAVSGDMRLLPQFELLANSTLVPLTLEPSQSAFIVFRAAPVKSATGVVAVNFPEPELLTAVSGPWQVSFDAGLRGPAEPVIFQDLDDWSVRPEAAIKYYSGTAVYKTSFDLNTVPAQRLYLDLGRVCAMAQVKLNGREVGSVWTAPWQTDITSAAKQGENLLEVRVVNTWVNRLIGDANLPLEQRRTWCNVNPFKVDSPLQSAGLMGPVGVYAVTYAMEGAVQAK